MNESYLGAEHEPGEILALASAMAQRNIREQHWQQSILAQTVPILPQPPVEVAQSIQTGATAAMLESLEKPDVPIDPLGIVRVIVDDKAISDLILSGGEEPSEESNALARSLIEAQVKTTWDHFIADQYEQQKMKDHLDAAKRVADSHSVAISEVFESDDLYAECVRAQYTPQTYAEDILTATEKLNQDWAMAAIESTVEATLQAELTNGEITAAEYGAEKAEIMRDLLADEEMLADVDASMSAFRHAGQILITRGIERFWGKPVLDSSHALLGQLAMQQADAPTLSQGLRRLQQYNDIIITICMEQGWDPDRLTVEQSRYIHSTSTMQNFKNED